MNAFYRGINSGLQENKEITRDKTKQNRSDASTRNDKGS
jgi:hypothetical protein